MRIIIFLSALLLWISCSKKESELDMNKYKMEIEQWNTKRIEDLKGANGWLNLAGLFWLKEGVNTFGSDSTNDVVFPSGKIAGKAGTMILQNSKVEMMVQPGVDVRLDSVEFKSGIAFYPDSTQQPKFNSGSLQWFIIKRDDKYGVRLRDFESQELLAFKGIDRYEVNPDYRVEAKLEVPSPLKQIEITNVLGQTTPQDSPGTLVFELDGEEYWLDALQEGDELFVIFGDKTNKKETYPSGRYLYADMPDADGKVILDFNKSRNPPCAFTPFATCPLPPSQNILPIEVKAGEKMYHGYEH